MIISYYKLLCHAPVLSCLFVEKKVFPIASRFLKAAGRLALLTLWRKNQAAKEPEPETEEEIDEDLEEIIDIAKLYYDNAGSKMVVFEKELSYKLKKKTDEDILNLKSDKANTEQ